MAVCWSITTVYWLEFLFDDHNARCIPTTFAVIVTVKSCLQNDYVFLFTLPSKCLIPRFWHFVQPCEAIILTSRYHEWIDGAEIV